MNRPCRAIILSVWVCCITVLPSFQVCGGDRPQSMEIDPSKLQRNVIRNQTGTVQMPSHSLTVRVNGENSLGGRKVTATIQKSGTRRSLTASLNSSGDAVMVFQLGSVAATVHGNYRVTVAKGPSDPGHYASSANYCFDGTDPASRNVTVDSGHRNVSTDFALRVSIAWDRHGVCW